MESQAVVRPYKTSLEKVEREFIEGLLIDEGTSAHSFGAGTTFTPTPSRLESRFSVPVDYGLPLFALPLSNPPWIIPVLDE